jgi:hypothetical protein
LAQITRNSTCGYWANTRNHPLWRRSILLEVRNHGWPNKYRITRIQLLSITFLQCPPASGPLWKGRTPGA